MSDEFADVNQFDKYARAHGGWYYDNSWKYHDQGYSCYAGSESRDELGALIRLVLLSDCPVKGQGVVLEVIGWSQPEVWSGPIRTRADMDVLQTFAEAWDQHHQAKT